MRSLLVLISLMALPCIPALADATDFAARNGDAAARVLVVYSSLDTPIAVPMIEGFQAANPDVAVRYEELLTTEIYDRVRNETDAGGKTADIAFSSAMDLQVKLANDGYAQESPVSMSDRWPRWANWRDTAYALTFEPAVFVYYKPAFRDRQPPATREQFIAYLKQQGEAVHGRIGTYDIERSGVGFMLMARDQEQFPDVWGVVRAMGAAGVKLYSTSSAIVERIADGRFVLGYNILGSYAADMAARDPDIGILLPEDYTVVMSRIGLVPAAAASPDVGRRFLDYFMSASGQEVLARQLHIGAINPDVAGENTANRMQAALGPQLRPVPVSPGLMVYLDQVKRMRLIQRWNQALRDQ